MSPELEKKIVEKYPKFFDYLKEYKGEMILPMMFGIEFGDGWYWLLDNLMDSIQGYIDGNGKPQVQAAQIKEKFGGLRFYTNGNDELVDGMIWLAEHMSYNICEHCGSTKNVSQTKGWITTLCEDCMKEINNKRLDTQLKIKI